MIPMRKVIIGAAAALAVIIAFLIYSNNSDSVNIEQESEDMIDIVERHDFGDTPRIGNSAVGGATNSGYILRDPVTKEIVRTFGFEKLLTPESGEKWRLQKPYMHFFGDQFECRITSDEGNFQVKEVMGKPSPQNARLYGNVRIDITFQNEGVPTNGVIYLDDLDYDSEMSKLHTNNSVKAVFDDAVMKGKKMTLIYNSAKSRIEYLDMKELDYIKIKNLAMLSEDRKGDKVANEDIAVSTDTADDTAETLAALPVVNSGSDISEKQPASEPDKVADTGQKTQGKADYYHCRFLKDVNIEYGDELVVRGHEELNIKNLLFSQSAPGGADTAKPSEEQTPPAQTSGSSDNKDKVPASDGSPATVKNAVADAGPANNSEQTAKGTTEVLLTCSEGFIVQLMSRIDSEPARTQPVSSTLADTILAALDKKEKAKSGSKPDVSSDKGLIYADAYANTNQMPLVSESVSFAAAAETEGSGSVSEVQKMPTRFHARKIDYDMNTKYAYATGPISLLIYGKPDPNAGPDQPIIPINITAADNAEYYGEKDQFVFNGQVKGIKKITGQLYDTENSVNGDQLVVDLNSSNKNHVDHISVIGETVEMFSERKAAEELLSLTRLKCKRIDYDASDEIVTAMGPGVIEIDNSKAPVVELADEKTDSNQITLKEPCFALIEDFDSLKWYQKQNKLVADGNSSSVKIQHIPVIKLEPLQFGKVTSAAARRIEASFITSPQGRPELSGLTASNAMSFMERQGDEVTNSFIGDKLFYNVSNSTMLVTGTEGAPCIVNGFNTDKIIYNLATGELLTNVSGPSMIQLPPKPE